MGKKQLEKYLNSMIKYSQVLYITAGSQKSLLPLYQKALWMEWTEELCLRMGPREAATAGSCEPGVWTGWDGWCHWSDKRQRQKGVSSHWHPKKSTLQDPLRAVQGYLYWSLEPCPCGLLCGSSWAESLPSSHRDKLDLQDWSKSVSWSEIMYLLTMTHLTRASNHWVTLSIMMRLSMTLWSSKAVW